jgi:hypothetical protein
LPGARGEPAAGLRKRVGFSALQKQSLIFIISKFSRNRNPVSPNVRLILAETAADWAGRRNLPLKRNLSIGLDKVKKVSYHLNR